jgi:hypothetical protein
VRDNMCSMGATPLCVSSARVDKYVQGWVDGVYCVDMVDVVFAATPLLATHAERANPTLSASLESITYKNSAQHFPLSPQFPLSFPVDSPNAAIGDICGHLPFLAL